jgi:single-strand DNA-binding protein
LKQTPTGLSVCTFGLAVARPNAKDTTDFINCVAWRNTAEFISKYFKKGNLIALTGVLTSRKYEDQKGNSRTVFEVVIDRAEFCESKREETKPETKHEEISNDIDLPF